MKTINSLADLLTHYVKSLLSVEEEIAAAMPAFIENANHPSVRKALEHHFGLAKLQKERLQKVRELIDEKLSEGGSPKYEEAGQQLAIKGMMGLIEDFNELLKVTAEDNVKDAVIIASVQNIEHYEICMYGTALSFANQLHLHKVAALLNETLQEEYDADDLFTALATASINKQGITEDNNDNSKDELGMGEIFEDNPDSTHSAELVSERSINSPGGRAGTSHRGYGTGESRGH